MFGRLKDDHKHEKEEWTGRSKEIEVNLYIQAKGTPINMGGVPAYHNLAYAVCVVTCKKCGEVIQRRSIVVRPGDLELPHYA